MIQNHDQEIEKRSHPENFEKIEDCRICQFCDKEIKEEGSYISYEDYDLCIECSDNAQAEADLRYDSLKEEGLIN